MKVGLDKGLFQASCRQNVMLFYNIFLKLTRMMPLHQLLPSHFSTVWVPALTSFNDDQQYESVNQINPVCPKPEQNESQTWILIMGICCSNRNPSQEKFLSGFLFYRCQRGTSAEEKGWGESQSVQSQRGIHTGQKVPREQKATQHASMPQNPKVSCAPSSSLTSSAPQ